MEAGNISSSINIPLTQSVGIDHHGGIGSNLEFAYAPAGTSSPSKGPQTRSQKTASMEAVRNDKILTTKDLLPGDILLKWEIVPEPGTNHERNMEYQEKPFHNGIGEKSLGCPRNVHVLGWTQNINSSPHKDGPHAYGEAQIGDARGGGMMAVQATALQKGTYYVFRPEDSNLGGWAAQILMTWASEGAIPYQKSCQRKMLGTDNVLEFGEKVKDNTMDYALEAFDSTPAWPSIHNKKEHTGRKEDMTPGTICTTIVLAAYQAAQAIISAAKEDRAPNGNDIAALTGALAVDAQAVSPRTMEHLLFIGKSSDGKNQFTSLGNLEIKEGEATYTEEPYDRGKDSVRLRYEEWFKWDDYADVSRTEVIQRYSLSTFSYTGASVAPVKVENYSAAESIKSSLISLSSSCSGERQAASTSSKQRMPSLAGFTGQVSWRNNEKEAPGKPDSLPPKIDELQFDSPGTFTDIVNDVLSSIELDQ